MRITTKNEPVPAAAYEVQEIDLATERQKLLARDGLKPEHLDEMVTMKRGALYDSVIRAYFHGRDVGFNSGMVNTMKAARPAWLLLLIGALALPAAWILWRIALFLYVVATFTPPAG